MKVIIFYCLLFTIFERFHLANCQIISFDIPCKHDYECKSRFNPSAICRNNVCHCGSEFTNNLEICKGGAAQTHLLNHPCKMAQNCVGSNEFCNTTTSQCQCKQHYVRSENSVKCLPVITTLNEKCEESKQCQTLNNTTCSEGECRCKPGFHNSNGLCWQSIGLKQKCVKSEECSHIQFAECNPQNICDCSYESVLNVDQSKCLPKVRALSSDCSENSQCPENAVCTNNYCECNPNHHYVESLNKCFQNKGYNETCEINEECFLGESKEKSVKCGADKKCECADDYELTENTCKLAFGKSCERDDECSIGEGSPGSVKCIEKICKCAENLKRKGNKCTSDAGVAKVSMILLSIVFLFSKFYQ